MKKFKMLEKAMIDFPTGTVARFKSATNVDHTSDGVFRFCDFNSDGKLHIVCGKAINCFYSDGEWAIPIKESLLSGKCTIQVNNDREFDLLMGHYETKDWQWKVNGGRGIPTIVSFPFLVSYENEFHWSFVDGHAAYKKIQFNDFADEIGVSVPVFVMTSEDGVPLYVGDWYCECQLSIERGVEIWLLNNQPAYKITERSRVMTNPSLNKAFSTKEAAELFIKKNNKSKVIGLVFQSEAPAEVSVTAKNIYIYPKKYMHCHFSGEELEQIYDAYTSLR